MSINFQAFADNLYYMGVGMASIFIVIAAIIVMVLLLNRFTRSDKK